MVHFCLRTGPVTRPDRKRLARGTAALTAATVLAGLTAAGMAGSANADLTADKLDLVFLMDGSGSIDSADWSLQKQGYIEALNDPITFPRDGSVSISLVQWSYNGSTANTRVEVPLTVLEDSSDVTALAQDISGIQQIGANTNPGDAVKAGTDLLLSGGRQGADWSLCMSTDGTINSGMSLGTATTYAQNSGVDRYGVLAIEDSGFTEQTARSAYGPYVFGGGRVTVARSTAEFATLITGCVNPEMRVEALEVTQGVQSLRNDVSLVENRDAIVRAYVATHNDDVVRTSGRLRLFRDGVELPESPLAPVNEAQAITATDDPIARRSDRDSTLNFRLPRSLTTGTLEVRLELAGQTWCDNTDSRWNENCGTEVTFTAGRETLRQQMVSIAWDGMTEPVPTFQDAVIQSGRSQAQLPVADIEMSTGYLEVGDEWWTRNHNIPDAEYFFEILSALDSIKWDDGFSDESPQESKYYQGMIPGTNPLGEGHIGHAFLKSSAAFVGYAPEFFDGGETRNLFVHELGHSLGRWHTVSDAATGTFDFLKSGYCNERAPRWAEDYPYMSVIDGEPVYTMGVLGNPEMEVWATDTATFAYDEELAVSAPHDVYELMSYCDNDDSDNQGTWLGRHTWEKLRDGQLSDDYGSGIFSAAALGGSGLWVTGAYDPTSGDVTRGNVLPTSRTRAGDSSSQIVVKARAVDGTVLATAHSQETAGAGTSSGDNPDAPDAAPEVIFGAALEVEPAEVGSLVVEVDGETKATWQASASAPEVSQVRSAVRADGSVEVSWNAADADDAEGSDMRHHVFYSTDGGAHFTPVALGIDESATVFPAGALPGGSLTLRVVSSDGVRFGIGETAVTAPNNAPDVALTSPGPDEQFSAAQPIALRAETLDKEDGALDGAAVTWTSDRNGLLGTGTAVDKRADQLAEGWHTVTVTATDSTGARSAKSTRIFVSRIPGVEPTPQKRYEWGGFGSPVDEQGNATVQAGRTIPVKFSVDGETGDLSGVTSVAFVRDGATYALVRDGVGEYHVNVAIPKEWSGTMGTLEVKLSDGQVFTATFNFR